MTKYDWPTRKMDGKEYKIIYRKTLEWCKKLIAEYPKAIPWMSWKHAIKDWYQKMYANYFLIWEND